MSPASKGNFVDFRVLLLIRSGTSQFPANDCRDLSSSGSHLASTYGGLAILKLVGDDLEIIDTESIFILFILVQEKDLQFVYGLLSYGIVDYFDGRCAALAIITHNGRHLSGQPIKVNWAYEDTSVYWSKLWPENVAGNP
ncbi:hypothetical protein C5167_004122 [Papaver somniferum]|nr:hypothetical protein C5167_004122 [Papaver somniferum]